jgi:hydrogenase maturation factor
VIAAKKKKQKNSHFIISTTTTTTTSAAAAKKVKSDSKKEMFKHQNHTKLIIITLELSVLWVPEDEDDVFHMYMAPD